MHLLRITLLTLTLATSFAFADDVRFSEVFHSGGDPYKEVRIPSVVVTSRGTVLAFAEGRRIPNDHGQNDIILRRSTDGGETWLPLQTVHAHEELVLVNPCAVVLDTGRILLMYQQFPRGWHARPIKKLAKVLEPGYTSPYVSRTLLVHSDDDGETWSEPREVTRGTKRPAPIVSTAAGPGIGIVKQRAPHVGRIVIPTNEGWWEGDERSFNVYMCFSDDNGETWQYGEVAPVGNAGRGDEVQVVERADGTLLLNSRGQKGHIGARKIATSTDGGETWSELVDDPALVASGCMATILRHSWPEDGESRILFANPATTKGRHTGTVRMSYDEGKTWPVSRVVYPGDYAYSCLTRFEDGDVGLLFEADDYGKIVFARFGINWLTGE